MSEMNDEVKRLRRSSDQIKKDNERRMEVRRLGYSPSDFRRVNGITVRSKWIDDEMVKRLLALKVGEGLEFGRLRGTAVLGWMRAHKMPHVKRVNKATGIICIWRGEDEVEGGATPNPNVESQV
jgi:hypothetical protein